MKQAFSVVALAASLLLPLAGFAVNQAEWEAEYSRACIYSVTSGSALHENDIAQHPKVKDYCACVGKLKFDDLTRYGARRTADEFLNVDQQARASCRKQFNMPPLRK